MSLAPGTHLGPYEILAPIGAGGMGEVYRARDTKLDRNVAIKVLSAALAQDPERLARFRREAKALASLNHPHIAQIYGVEDQALIMELVEGEAPKGPLRLETALNYARQVAEALEAAHEKGIVHRDLKPGNVKITPDGVVKVLDFGLAAVAPASSDDLNPEDSPTLTVASRAGVIMGTAAYMSPEQASGKPADKRADIWSFGVVLWELLTGHRLFQGETVSHTLADVLRSPIGFDKLPRETPPAIRGLLRRCLDRNVKNRLRDIGEARIAIEAALAGETPLADNAPRPGGASRPWLAWSVVGLLAAILAADAFLHFREKPPAPAAPVRFRIPAPENTTLAVGFSLSPDGRKLAFMAVPRTASDGSRLWVHFLESGESRDLTEIGGSPFWSPDSRFIGYPLHNQLKKIEATGGPPQTVSDLPAVWGAGAWNQNDTIVFGSTVGLFRVPASGGVPVQIATLDPARQENSQFCPSFLPDGRHFVYIRASSAKEKSAIYLGSVDAKPEQQSTKPLVASNWGPVYASSADQGTGYLLFMREGTLMAQPFDNRRMELKGKAVPVAEQVADNGGGARGYGAFSASANNVLVYLRGGTSDRQLTWYDRAGKVLGAVGESGDYQGLALSPDGTRLALIKNNGLTSSNIWLLDFPRGTSTRFTFGSARDSEPVWSPDGSRVIFASNRDGQYDLYQKLVSGVKDEEVLLKSSEIKWSESWSRDGRFLLYDVVNPKTKVDIWVLPLEGDRKPVPFLVTEFDQVGARFSPDGHWVAYSSDESGKSEVYVRAFSMNPGGTATGASGKWHISNGFGVDPRWRGDGRELYYRSADGRVMAVEIATHPQFRAGKPQPLGPVAPMEPYAWWDSTADGKRFLLAQAPKRGPEQFTVVLNWQAGLK